MKNAHGFTLIELLVGLLIGAILVALAFPSYAGYVTRARRVEAQSHMMALLQLQERHFGVAYRYLAFSAEHPAQPETGMRWWTGPAPADSAYEYAGLPCESHTLQQCVRIRATPGTARVNRFFSDDECGVLEADSQGARSASGPGKGCWR
jgi:type IV pilus assembly protein PilE